MEVPPRQVAGFFNLLLETATTQTEAGRVHDSRSRQAREGTARRPHGTQPKIKAKRTVKFRVAKAVKDTGVRLKT